MLHWLNQDIWGPVWPNIAAEPIVLVLGFLIGYVFRDHIGKHLAKWWDKHHGPHSLARYHQAMIQHDAAKNWPTGGQSPTHPGE